MFKRRREIERIEAMRQVFNHSRAEDISKVFELGRIDALNRLRQDIYIIIGLVGSFVTILGLIFTFVFVPRYIDSIVDSRVEREIDKRIEKFTKFYSYTQDVIPIMEFDFYRIKTIDIQPSVVLNNKKKIERIPVIPREISMYAIQGNTQIHINFMLIELYSHDNAIFSKGVTASGEVHSYENEMMDRKTIDIMSEVNKLNINFEISITGDNYELNGESVKKIIDDNIKSINVSIFINNVNLHTHEIPTQDTGCNYEAISFSGLVSSLKCNIKHDVTKTYRNPEVVRTMYRSRPLLIPR
jgi:hypothetical protein